MFGASQVHDEMFENHPGFACRLAHVCCQQSDTMLTLGKVCHQVHENANRSSELRCLVRVQLFGVVWRIHFRMSWGLLGALASDAHNLVELCEVLGMWLNQHHVILQDMSSLQKGQLVSGLVHG